LPQLDPKAGEFVEALAIFGRGPLPQAALRRVFKISCLETGLVLEAKLQESYLVEQGMLLYSSVDKHWLPRLDSSHVLLRLFEDGCIEEGIWLERRRIIIGNEIKRVAKVLDTRLIILNARLVGLHDPAVVGCVA